MKRFRVLAVLALVFVLGFAGCGKSQEPKDDTATTTEGSDAETKVTIAENTYVAIGEYKGITYDAVKTEVTAEMVANEIDYLLDSYAETVDADHDVVQEGDTIVFDFSGIHNGERFEGGTSDDFRMENVGNGGFIPGFEENLIGKRVGEEFSFEITFPDPYPNNTELSGEPVTFEIKIEKIEGTKVLPELTDDFVANVQTVFEAKTVDELRESIKSEMTAYYEEQDKTDNMAAAWDVVTSGFVTKEENQAEIDRYTNEFIEYYKSLAESYGYDDFEAFLLQNFVMDEEDFQNEAVNYAKVLVTEDAGVALIAELEGLQITDTELAAGYEKFQNDYGMDKEAVLNYFGTEDSFKRELLYDKVTEFVYDNAVPRYAESADK